MIYFVFACIWPSFDFPIYKCWLYTLHNKMEIIHLNNSESDSLQDKSKRKLHYGTFEMRFHFFIFIWIFLFIECASIEFECKCPSHSISGFFQLLLEKNRSKNWKTFVKIVASCCTKAKIKMRINFEELIAFLMQKKSFSTSL